MDKEIAKQIRKMNKKLEALIVNLEMGKNELFGTTQQMAKRDNNSR